MLRKIFTVLMASALLISGGARAAADYEDCYTVVADTGTAAPELRIFMSFWCGHCFASQDRFADLAAHYADKAKVCFNPVNMLGGAAAVPSQRAYALAVLKGVGPEFARAFFDLVQVEEKYPIEQEDIAKIFNTLGVPTAEFNREYGSFVITGMVSAFDRECERVELDAVPSVMVNGRYMVNIDVFDKPERAREVIDYLLTR